MDDSKDDVKPGPETPPSGEPAAAPPAPGELGPSAAAATPATPPLTVEASHVASAATTAAPVGEVAPVAAIPAPPLAEASAGGSEVRAAYEHPWAIRFCHWLNAIALVVMIASGLQIFTAFPSFGPKVPQKDLLQVPDAVTLGGWLAGGRHWHFTFMWLFVGTGIVYLGYQFVSGHYKTVLFRLRDIPGVWPMVHHYFFFGPKPPVGEQYNPLQKLAYTATVLFGVASVLTGLVLYQPIQFSWLAWLMGGFHWARIWHFAAMCGFLAFIPGHLLMVALHGWSNFASMLTGWKKNPEYLSD